MIIHMTLKSKKGGLSWTQSNLSYGTWESSFMIGRVFFSFCCTELLYYFLLKNSVGSLKFKFLVKLSFVDIICHISTIYILIWRARNMGSMFIDLKVTYVSEHPIMSNVGCNIPPKCGQCHGSACQTMAGHDYSTPRSDTPLAVTRAKYLHMSCVDKVQTMTHRWEANVPNKN